MRTNLARAPWLALGFLLTGCPLSDHYSLTSDASGGSPNSDAGSGASAGSADSSLGGLAGGSSGAAGSAGNPSAGSAGSSAAGSSAQAGMANTGGEAGQGPTAGFGGSGGNAAGTSGDSGSAGISGNGGTAGVGGAGGASSAGGATSCSVSTCSNTCCAVSGCVDTTRDFQNCGSCGKLCNAGRSCMASACTPGWVPMAPPPVGFVARWRAASVAMGKSVFIWGGSDGSGVVLDSGAIYSPTTDSWTAVAKDAYTPTARVLATAVWTGSVVVVFGGSDATGATPYKDGAIYNPALGAWSSIPAASKARSSALGFWDGTRAVFWGGVGVGAAAVAGADRFDLTTWSASGLTGDPGAVLSPAYGWDGAALYLQGGQAAGARTDKVFGYTSNTDTWASLSKSLSARSNAFGVWDGARFLVWGGNDGAGLRNDGKFLGPSPSTAWTNLSMTNAPSVRMAVPRRAGWIFQTSPGMIAIFGGQTSTFGAGTFTTTGATYDVANAKWAAVPAFASGEAHDFGVGVWTGDEFVLWGGRTGAALSPSLTGERWKP